MDPWQWTIDDVIFHFCNSRDLWDDRPNSTLPEPVAFARALRENETNGSSLLSGINQKVLADDFGIRSLGQKQAIIFAVEKLKTWSNDYASHHAALFAVETRIRDQARMQSPAPTPPPALSRSNNTVPSAVQSPLARPSETAVEPRDGGNKRRKVLMESIPSSPRLPGTTTKKHVYLSKEKFTADQAFYGAALVGSSVTDGDDDPDVDFTFLQASRGVAPGRQLYMRSLMRHFLRAEPQVVDNHRLVVYPYSSHLFRNGRIRSATVYRTSGPGKVAVIMADSMNLDPDMPPPTDEFQDNHDWDFLDHWNHMPKDENKTLPALSESDDVWTGSLMAEIQADIQEDQAEDAQESPQSRNLSSQEVEDAIEEAIEAITQGWRDVQLPRLQHKARSIWKKAQGRTRQIIIGKAQQDLERVNNYLLRLKNDLQKNIWTKVREVKRQCAVMDVTLHNKLEQEFKLELWASPHLPPRSTNVKPEKPSRAVGARPLKSDDDGGIILESESEDMGDFIEDDEELASEETRVKRIYVPAASIHVVKAPVEQASSHVPDSISESETIIPMREKPVEEAVPAPAAQPAVGEESADDMQLDSDKEPAAPDNSTKEQHLTPSERFAFERSTTNVANDATSEVANAEEGNSPRNRYETSADSVLDTPPEPEDTQEPEPETGGGKSLATAIDLTDNEREHSTIEEIDLWDMNQLVERQDQKRFLLKLLRSIDDAFLMSLYEHLKRQKSNLYKWELQRGLAELWKPKGFITNSPTESFEHIKSMTRLYVCWRYCSSIYLSPQEPKLSEAARVTLEARKATSNIAEYYNYVRKIVTKVDTPFAQEIGLMRVGKRTPTHLSPRKGQAIRDLAHERRDRAEIRARRYELKTQSTSLHEGTDDLVINPDKAEDEQYIRINPHIAKSIKPHQIEGVRFLWREVTGDGGEELSGCLLAHTMGLGKTMQTITLMATIYEVNNDPTLTKQLPKALRTPPGLDMARIMVLCPAGLIVNWLEELQMWISDMTNLFVVALTSEKSVLERTTDVRVWFETGGILIIGYDLFRNTVAYKAENKKTNSTQKELSELQIARQQLLDGPAIVIADEAHKIKNSSSAIGTLVGKFRTQCRVALTGSPLANSLDDYYVLIDWVSPGYLGDPEDFREDYQNPIVLGMYADSTLYEQRKSLKVLQALKDEIDPKVHRKDIMAIRDDLPAKTEFVLNVDITDVQKQAYSNLIGTLQINSAGTQVATTSLLDWMNILTLLVYHPSVYLKKLEARVMDSQNLKISPQTVQDQRDLLNTPSNTENTSAMLFPKTAIIAQILRSAKRMGEKVLVFSHRIPVLDHLEAWLQSSKECSYLRLDGSTKTSSRQELLREFNDGKYDVFLVSTTAGALGLNVTGANRIILVDFGFNPTWEEQAVGRGYRLGQKKHVFVYHLVSGGTFEETLHHRCIFKKQLAIKVVDKKNVKAATTKVKDFLFPPRDVEQQDLESYVGKDKIMDEILRLPAGGSIRALQTTDILQHGNEQLTEEELKEVKDMKASFRARQKLRARPSLGRALPTSGTLVQMTQQLPQPTPQLMPLQPMPPPM